MPDPDKTYTMPVTLKYKRYAMGSDQPAQIDCRVVDCVFHKEGCCCNVSPALTLNPNLTFRCWSERKLD